MYEEIFEDLIDRFDIQPPSKWTEDLDEINNLIDVLD